MLGLCVLISTVSGDDVMYIGRASIAGKAPDKSKLPGNITTVSGADSGIAQATFGSAGSAIDYTGHDGLYLMASDRGPRNGDASYLDRVQMVRIVVHPGAAVPVEVENTATTLLTTAEGKYFTGAANAYVGGKGFAEKQTLRLDPEGIRCLPDGSFWISDEYGPYVLHFDATGKQIGAFDVPAKYGVTIASADETAELSSNKIGRQPNRGMEGLAITPDGKTLVGLMQNCLLQDHALDKDLKRVSKFSRILTMNLVDHSTHEYIYPLQSEKYGLNEILAIDAHQFLVIERDGKEGAEAKAKYIQKIDLTDATDISKPFTKDGKTLDYSGTTATNGLPAEGPIEGATLPKKTLFLDMLSAAGGLSQAELPEKIEGLAWGPDFENGDKLLIITSDNDFRPEQPTYFYAYRVKLSN